MVKFIRYALAAVCFAASVGCLALWWRSMSTRDVFIGPRLGGRTHSLESFNGRGIYCPLDRTLRPGKVWRSFVVSNTSGEDSYGTEWFGHMHDAVYFPL